jgi:hypothetical protein
MTITRFNSILSMSLEEKEPAGAFNRAQRLIECGKSIHFARKIQGPRRASARSEVLVTATEIALWLRFNSSQGEVCASHFGLGFGAATPSTIRPVCDRAPSVERHPQPFFLAPDDVTRPLQLLALNDRRETIRKKSGVATSSAAPVSESLRTVQSIVPPPNEMVPAFRMRWRGAA